MVVTEHEFTVPLDHAAPEGGSITVFAREVADPDGLDRPYLVFLQGGPGFEAARPALRPLSPGWLERALQDYRVLLLDQRGTGRSTPVGPHTLAGMTPAEQADHLACFRADAIVADCERIRAALGGARWSLLGQSFGGLCAVSYLSRAPEGLREVFVCGGMPTFGPGAVERVYGATYPLVAERTAAYYARYPQDRDRVRRLVELGVELPSGDVLTPARVRALGEGLGASDGAEALHHLLELDPHSPAFRHDAEAALPFARNPLYALVHEACWADGGATRWAAERLLPDAYAQDPTLLCGEHVFPWMFEDVGALAPLREAAHLLAEREWPRLYDEEVLARNEVPVAAAIYAHDLYVPRATSEATARQIRGARYWLTSEYEHNGLRADGGRILGRLIDLVRGRA